MNQSIEKQETTGDPRETYFDRIVEDKLSKEQRYHLRNDAGVYHMEGLRRNLDDHYRQDVGSGLFSCYECRAIYDRLGVVPALPGRRVWTRSDEYASGDFTNIETGQESRDVEQILSDFPEDGIEAINRLEKGRFRYLYIVRTVGFPTRLDRATNGPTAITDRVVRPDTISGGTVVEETTLLLDTAGLLQGEEVVR